MLIRPIEAKDNAIIERIIRECLIEFGGNREGLAWEDDSLSRLADFYTAEGQAYWVVEQDGEVVGGCGISPFADSAEVCELQKMYLLTSSRGTGIAATLLDTALSFARLHYQQCYLETLSNMIAANRFYVKHGFVPLEAPLAGSEHFACDAWYIKPLADD
ncbi:GNAT family N-acetyltransferase [Paenibacillus rhizovicinus]|uniref:GNAT family N-acetyltransferase n=1 Tax=Paenibacillus rhizovicinus TaxID=2704463 RepID=A0A6C0NU55_9BACL|nr:GNAT family N-acetyltransferase [Paenibacillus rhizovicinus]QHW29708.1 GNAT family N-acetyltransferase [Paenibacillus rhizovicinus]